MGAYKYLNFVQLLSLNNWNIKHITYNEKDNTKFNMVEIGNLIKRNRTAIVVKDNVDYKRITIKINNNGVCVRDTEIGKKIKTKNQFVVSTGQFVISKIDARNGAFGIVPEEAENAIITGNFWAYDINCKMANINYLLFILSTKYFVEKWYVCSNGSGNRLYLQENLFLKTKIPLPTLVEQEQIISEYENKINKANQMREQANMLTASIDDILFEELGVEKIKKEKPKTKFLNFVLFNKLVKWGVEINSAYISPVDMLKSTIYDNKPLGTIAQINPTVDFSNLLRNDEITFLPMECISDIYGEVLEKRQATVDTAKGYTKFQENDIIWAKITPCMQNGKSAIVSGLINNVGCGSTEYHVIRTDNKKILNTYVYHILRTNLVRQVATLYFSGSAGQQRVGADYLENLYIPIPSLEQQRVISNKISNIRDEIKNLNASAEKLLRKASKNFEETIFFDAKVGDLM
jgi:type I restriction enzyme S subunit